MDAFSVLVYLALVWSWGRRSIRFRRLGKSPAIVGFMMVAFLGCNEHPITPLDQILTAAHHQQNLIPAKTKIDFFFVIDDSGSMCEEQANLGRNFTAFSNFLYEKLGGSADYRIAVTSTDLISDEGGKGQFLTGQTNTSTHDNCESSGISFEERRALTARCQQLKDLGELSPILRSDSIGTKEQLEERFSCMATLGTGGSGFEKGLEAMRLALSCNGPNAEAFGGCCVADQLNPTVGRQTYNPSCIPELVGGEPQFLRPDALLVVIFVTDENDCSDPRANSPASQRAICKYAILDRNEDGIPDGYEDPELCPGGDIGRCYRADCGDLTPGACSDQVCEISQDTVHNCEWQRASLTPVDDYFNFLAGLKSQPLEQLVIATIVGQRGYTSQGFEISFDQGEVPAGCQAQNTSETPPNLGEIISDACCPEGRCLGRPYPSCQSANGTAFAGTRYLELSDQFGSNGIGCSEPELGSVSDTQITECDGQQLDSACGCDQGACDGKCRPIPNDHRLACVQCLSICEDNFQAPLEAIKDKVAEVLATYCLDKPPRCQVDTPDGPRHCATTQERQDSANYQIRVRRRCGLANEDENLCAQLEESRVLATNEWVLDLNDPECLGGAHIRLLDTPPPGAEILLDFFVEVAGVN